VWYWVVSDQRVERRIESEIKPRKLPPARPGSEKSAAADDFTARRQERGVAEEMAPELQGPPAPAFIVEDGKRDLEEVLLTYADRPVHLPADVVQRWARSGLRVYAVPRAEVESVEGQLRLVGAVQRQWLGEMPAWTEIAEGPWEEGGLAVEVAGDRVRLEPGRVRLLARAWTAPIAGPEGARASLRVELVPQHEPSQTEQQRMLMAAGLSKGDEARGLAIERLGLGESLTSDDALVIVPVDAAQPENLRPFQDSPRTLGQAMLTRGATETTARARAVIVLLPHIAERFELIE
jgi:hypothetical protein